MSVAPFREARGLRPGRNKHQENPGKPLFHAIANARQAFWIIRDHQGAWPVKFVEGGGGADLRIILCVQFDRRAAPSEIAALKATLTGSPNCVHSSEVTGSFDFIAEFAADSIPWYNKWLAPLADQFAGTLHRYEANFVLQRSFGRALDEEAVWVPENGGYRRIDSALIDKITAEGDYIRIHSRAESWLVHETMKSISRRMHSEQFIRIHRSVIVRLDFIKRVARRDRQLVVHLADGTSQTVARSHAAEMLNLIRAGAGGRPNRASHEDRPHVHQPLPQQQG